MRRPNMLDPDKAHAWVKHHFETVTDEEFIENVRRFNPEFAEEMWGSRTTAEILEERAVTAPAPHALGLAPMPGRKRGDDMIDPETARAVLREYHSAASDQQIVDDLRRHSPELARRLAVEAVPRPARPGSAPGKIRGLFTNFGRSVLKLFS
jgi:hypothetical protein